MPFCIAADKPKIILLKTHHSSHLRLNICKSACYAVTSCISDSSRQDFRMPAWWVKNTERHAVTYWNSVRWTALWRVTSFPQNYSAFIPLRILLPACMSVFPIYFSFFDDFCVLANAVKWIFRFYLPLFVLWFLRYTFEIWYSERFWTPVQPVFASSAYTKNTPP